MTVWFPMHPSINRIASALPKQNEPQKNALFFAGRNGNKRQKLDSAAAAASDTFVSSSRHSQENPIPGDILSQEALLALELLPDEEGPDLELQSLYSEANTWDFDNEFQDFDDTWIFQDHPTTTTTPFAVSPSFATPLAHSSSSAFQPPTGEVALKQTRAEHKRLRLEKRAQALLGPEAKPCDLERLMREKYAKERLGPDAKSADYGRLRATKRAQALFGPDAKPADYDRHQRTARAQKLLGPDAKPADYDRHQRTAQAQALFGPDAKPADYTRHKRIARAQALLGPDAKPADYNVYRKAIHEGELPQNATKEQFWEFRSTMRTYRKKAELQIPDPSPKPGS